MTFDNIPFRHPPGHSGLDDSADPRVDAGFLCILVLLIVCTWVAIVRIHISLTPRFVAVNQHIQE